MEIAEVITVVIPTNDMTWLWSELAESAPDLISVEIGSNVRPNRDIARKFFDQVRAEAAKRALLSDEHFTVDGTLIEAWAGLKSFQRKDTPAVVGRHDRCPLVAPRRWRRLW